ncbi:hypothetical protein SBD_3268 [Streptomyces bottropensis ATCC 25435]|uniref:Uncharacterized protein n=1 Tax=Streptomyces bottropensis ATCC 25435 TaxID=1054862 RepID=M3FSJ9_9ACTN|nr:hypothetical protein SBD_3268 [Streptomyces bottropensis ATCC 25435]
MRAAEVLKVKKRMRRPTIRSRRSYERLCCGRRRAHMYATRRTGR